MKVTVENKKGLNKDIKVFIDKKTMNSYMDEIRIHSLLVDKNFNIFIKTFFIFYCNFHNLLMVGRKGLEPSQIALSVPKTDASTNSAIAPQIQVVLYIIGTICPMTIV